MQETKLPEMGEIEKRCFNLGKWPWEGGWQCFSKNDL